MSCIVLFWIFGKKINFAKPLRAYIGLFIFHILHFKLPDFAKGRKRDDFGTLWCIAMEMTAILDF